MIRILLARMIAPSEFGLLALLTIFIALSELIITSGLGQAIIQRKEISRIDVSTVFVFNFAGSLLVYTLLFCCAPYIASFYEEPRLVVLLRVVALSIVIRSLGKIHHSLLVRELKFKSLFLIATPSIVLGGIVGVTMALLEFEVWALVGSQLTSAVVASFCYWCYAKVEFRPRFEFCMASFTKLWKFGVGVFGSSFLYFGMQNSYGLLIGKAFSFGELAFYNQARTFQRSPVSAICSIVNRVLFPVFSTIQNNDEKIRAALRKGFSVLAFIIFPVMGFMICAADEIVVTLLTEKWIRTADLLRWFPIIGMLAPISAVQLTVLKAKGKTGLFFWASVFKNALAITALLATINYGLLAIVLGQVVVSALGFGVNLILTRMAIDYKAGEVVKDISPYALLTGIAIWIAMMLESTANFQSCASLLLLKALVFFVFYIVSCHVLQLSGLSLLKQKFSEARPFRHHSKAIPKQR